ncbi:lysozyme inhibitor LprI family protein [Erwinia papayae]|uniref:Lysozyme inhibitor LprI family protein n=1 Tax=Erwinia papayae TaxID=206499 RepID=A0ABV3N4L1_9GAMM
MKKIKFLLICSLATCTGFSYAYSKLPDILSNKEVDLCSSKFGDNNDECLSEISNKSELSLKQVYDHKLKSIESFDYNLWWMGSEEQKQQMITKFKASQKTWINYRDTFCQAAVTSAQNTHDLGKVTTSCILNMNERRIEEINFVNTNMTD